MDLDAFERSLAEPAPPPGLGTALLALWWARKPDWDRAHGLAQQHEGDPAHDWVHAHLHRIEGDLENAGYWYRSARQPVATAPLPTEWRAIATALLPPPSP